MESGVITIRQAVPGDAEAIWHLLRCENKAWDVHRISKEIHSLHVLFRGKKLVGVFHGRAAPGGEKITWMAVHPMYPESSVRLFLAYGFFGVACRMPANKVRQLIKSPYGSCKHKSNPIGFGIR